MLRVRGTLVIAAMCVSAILVLRYVETTAMGSPKLEIPAKQFMRMAVDSPLPAYPPSSFTRGHHGVAVALVTVEGTGNVKAVEVLESPDTAVAGVVRDALRAWTFQVTGQGVEGGAANGEFNGRVILYFVIDRGRSLVLMPDQEGVRRQAGLM